jgi:hypothetical protein
VSDIWAVGDYVDFPSFEHIGVSAHYNGSAWAAGPPMGTGVIPTGIWGLVPGGYESVTTGGKILLLNPSPTNPTWLVCGNFGCSDPQTAKPLYAIYGFSMDDFWVGGLNAMYQCSGVSCTAKTAGLPTDWGQGNFTGTSSTDLWYSSIDRAFHYDGNTWTTHASIQARAIWAHAANDVWCGDSTLQHYDGTTWSLQYNIGGAPAPGIITSMSGTASNDVWAVGYDPSLYNDAGFHAAFSAHWDGTGWGLVPMPESAGEVQTVWAASKDQVFAASFLGRILQWDGISWSEMALPTSQDGGVLPGGWNAIWGSARARP